MKRSVALSVTIVCFACVVNPGVSFADKHTLLSELAEEADIHRRLAMLPKITAAYAADELPPDVTYLLALKLLRDHLTWHVAYPPPKRLEDESLRKVVERVGQARIQYVDGWRWDEAHPGESWMLDPRQREQLEQQWTAAATEDPKQPRHYFWRLEDADHEDVIRAKKLLQEITSGELARKARRWWEEIERNNTVVTMDVVGAYQAGKKSPVVVDVRNAEQLGAKLYRVRGAGDVVSVAQRIGKHFVYHDYGLQHGRLTDSVHAVQVLEELWALSSRRECAGKMRKLPDFRPDDLVGQWNVAVQDLKALDLRRHGYTRRYKWDDGYDYDSEARYFDDRCEWHRRRLEKSYWPGWDRPSSWQCDRLLEIPAEALKRPGAYILVLEANGQRAYAPIIVDPLAMVLRRCRDGVFVMVSDADNNQPVAGARICSDAMLGGAVTNADGVAFTKVFAVGDRAIIAEKDGRYAVGGFGDVFKGIYESDFDYWRDEPVDSIMRRVIDRRIRETVLGHAYTDRYVVAAYTDRPTYRPGQEVNFKLIVRHLPAADPIVAADSTEFRAGDFELARRLVVPKDARAAFDVLNPKGRTVGSGELTVNDFGTAAAAVSLSPEAKTGSYSLRVRVGGVDRIVPKVFEVKHYRRPNFELTIAGLPEAVAGGDVLDLDLSGRYYFGKPVANATVDVRLVRPHAWKPLAHADVRLGVSGTAAVKLELPKRLKPGTYRLIGSLTDSSGRTATRILACRVEGRYDERAAGGLSDLPRFVAAGQTLAVRTGAGKVVAQPLDNDVSVGRASSLPLPVGSQAGSLRHGTETTFNARRGVAELKMDQVGWYRLNDGEQETTIYVYGGENPPSRRLEELAEGNDSPYQPRWINLTDYDLEEDGHSRRPRHDPATLLALFDQQHVEVGGKLRVLVYAPYDRARLLLTVEGRTVVDYVVEHVTAQEDSGHYHVVELPIKPRYLPNFYVQGRIVSFAGVLRDTDRAERALVQLGKSFGILRKRPKVLATFAAVGVTSSADRLNSKSLGIISRTGTLARLSGVGQECLTSTHICPVIFAK